MKTKEGLLVKLEEDEKEQTEKLSVLAGFPDLKREEGILYGQLDKLKTKVNDLNNEEKRLFKNKWMLKGTSDIFRQADNEISKFSKYRRSLVLKNEKQLEEGVPGDSLIDEMLEKEHCIICDRPAPKNSKEYKSIESHLDLNKDISPLAPLIDELNNKIINLKGIPSRLILKTKDVNEEITKHQTLIFNTIKERNEQHESLTKVQEKIKDINQRKGT